MLYISYGTALAYKFKGTIQRTMHNFTHPRYIWTQFSIQSFLINCLAVVLMGRLGGCSTLVTLSQNVDGRLSQTIYLERGVLQGSVLSPTLFLMVMDPLLRKLEQHSLGLCLGDLYCGAYAHADDICTITTSRRTLVKQISVFEFFY